MHQSNFFYRLTNKTNRVTSEHCEQSTHLTNLTVDDPAVIQRMRTFHSDLRALRNTLCNVCLERFPSVKTNEAGVSLILIMIVSLSVQLCQQH